VRNCGREHVQAANRRAATPLPVLYAPPRPSRACSTAPRDPTPSRLPLPPLLLLLLLLLVLVLVLVPGDEVAGR
jgi:hypothetical protein